MCAARAARRPPLCTYSHTRICIDTYRYIRVCWKEKERERPYAPYTRARAAHWRRRLTIIARKLTVLRERDFLFLCVRMCVWMDAWVLVNSFISDGYNIYRVWKESRVEKSDKLAFLFRASSSSPLIRVLQGGLMQRHSIAIYTVEENFSLVPPDSREGFVRIL